MLLKSANLAHIYLLCDDDRRNSLVPVKISYPFWLVQRVRFMCRNAASGNEEAAAKAAAEIADTGAPTMYKMDTVPCWIEITSCRGLMSYSFYIVD